MKQKIALVLSGGGAKGLAHIGVIEELEQQGYEISSIAGTSMGALVGGVYAAGHMEEYKNWMYTLDRTKVLRLIDFTIGNHGLVKGDKVFKTMKEFVPEMNIESLHIPYAAVAVDLITNEEVIFTKGSLYEAIRASVSIPTVLTPVRKNNQILVDGGVLNNIPLNRIARTEGDILVAVNVNARVPLQVPPSTKEEEEKKKALYQQKLKEFYAYLPRRSKKQHQDKFGYFNLLNKTTNLMTGKIAQLSLEIYKPDILINVSRDSCGGYDFYKAEEVVENGRYAAHLCLDQLKINC